MKFKILNGTALFVALLELKTKIDSANDERDKLVKELGFEDVGTSGRYLAGGIQAIHIPHHKDVPADWKRLGDKYSDFYMPKASGKDNKALWKKIEALPVVQNEELNKLLKYSSGAFSRGSGIGWARRPAIAFGKTVIVVDTGELKIKKPADGMIEILDSEYDKLKSKIDKTKKETAKKAKA